MMIHDAAATTLFFTARIGVASATATEHNVRVMNACLRKEKRRQSQQPPVNSLQVRRSTI